MDESFIRDQDYEYKQYLEIMRPQLGQLKDRRTIALCRAWIQRLSSCRENEKVLRNKYLLSLCYQLAKGTIEEPFLVEPTDKELNNITVPTFSDVTNSDLECLLVNSEADTKVLYNTNLTDTSQTQDAGDSESRGRTYNTSSTSLRDTIIPTQFQSILCYHGPETNTNNNFIKKLADNYEHRTNNIISRLREIKKQNKLLQSKLQELREISDDEDCDEELMVNVNNTKNTFSGVNQSVSKLNSMKYQLSQVQQVKNALIDKIQDMQETIDQFHDSKFMEFEAIQAKHRLELITLKLSIRNELAQAYEKRLDELVQAHETKVKKLEENHLKAIQDITLTKDGIIKDKDNAIQLKDAEIAQLSTKILSNGENLQSVLVRFLDKTTNDEADGYKLRNEFLERRLQKLEKAKDKCLKVFEAKVATMQRENYLTDCSLQLQLARGRAQVVHDLTSDSEAELKRALGKLEAKYNVIVANMQATAIQRRIQDQVAVDSILQAASGIQDSFNIFASRNPILQKSNKHNCEREASSLFRGKKAFGNIIVSVDKAFGDGHQYCNEAEMDPTLEKACIPQRDESSNIRK